MIGSVKLLHILIAISFGDAGQTDFQNVYFLILAVNLALQLAFLGKSRKPFQVVKLKFPNIAFLFCLKDDLILST